MNALLRFLAAVLQLSFTAAFFGPAYRLLPTKVRLTSPGFISVGFLFLLASLLRHWGFANLTPAAALLGAVAWLIPLYFLLGTRGADFMVLAMAVSAGIDLTACAFGLFGVDVAGSSARALLLAWEFIAIVASAARLGTAKARQGKL